MTSATTWPTWLFISVTPARLDDVRSDLKRSSLMRTPPWGSRGRCRTAGRRSARPERSIESSKRMTFSAGWDQIGCSWRAASMLTGVHSVQPALHRLLVLRAVLLVVGEHPEQRARAALLARRVGLAGAHQRRRDEVALQRGDLHHEAAAEQLADQRLEDHRGGEERLGPVARAGQALDVLARLPARSGPPARPRMWAWPSKPSISSGRGRGCRGSGPARSAACAPRRPPARC